MLTKSFETDLTKLLNQHAIDNLTDTPDYLLAENLVQYLSALQKLNRVRERKNGTNREREVENISRPG